MSSMHEMWNDRYAKEEYAYGISPNKFFVESLDIYKPKGRILLPAEGEGRNAVYAAKLGLEVVAFDISVEGKKKALQLAKKENVDIQYEVGDLMDLALVNKSYDVAALIFAHFPPHLRKLYHRKIADLLHVNGLIILEGFSQEHQQFQLENPNAGGPKKKEMLLTKEMILTDFPDFEHLLLEEVEVNLNEGIYHNGIGKVWRFIGKKKEISS